MQGAMEVMRLDDQAYTRQPSALSAGGSEASIDPQRWAFGSAACISTPTQGCNL